MRKIVSEAAEYLAQKRRHRTWTRTVSVLACAVVMFTMYALILPAVTMEKPEDDLIIEEEYEVNEIAGEEISAGSFAGDEGDWIEIEGMAEVEDPSKDPDRGDNLLNIEEETEEEASDEGKILVLVCEEKDNPEHEHTDDCYVLVDEDSKDFKLICEKTDHIHTAECYTLIKEDDEILEEGQEVLLAEANVSVNGQSESEAETEVETETETEIKTETETETETEIETETETETETEIETETETEI